MKRSDPLFHRIVAVWSALGRRAEAEAQKGARGGNGRDADVDLDADLDADLDPEADELFVWTEGGLLLFTLLRVLLRNPDATSLETLNKEIAAALSELALLAGLDDEAVVAGMDLVSSPDAAFDVELAFLAAFNEHLMMRHQERLRFVDGTSIELAKLGLAANLTSNFAAGIDLDDAQTEVSAS